MSQAPIDNVISRIIDFLYDEYPKAFTSSYLGTKFGLKASSVSARLKRYDEIEAIPSSMYKHLYRYNKDFGLSIYEPLLRLVEELESRGFKGLKKVLRGD